MQALWNQSWVEQWDLFNLLSGILLTLLVAAAELLGMACGKCF